MIQKPKIQYVGQFYVHGSEAKKLELAQEQKKAKTRLPLAKLQAIEKIYVDPVALAAIAVAVVMLVTMVAGTLQILDDWAEYRSVSRYTSYLHQENARLTREYAESYDLEDIRTKATALGMVPREELRTMTMTVVLPEPEPEISRIQEIKDFLEGMFA